MLASLVIPVYGQIVMVLKLAQTLLQYRQTTLRDVTLVDDASKEFDLRELLKTPFNVHRNPVNLGFIGSVNQVKTEGKYLLIANSDLEMHPVWLDPAVELLENNPQIGIVGARLIFPGPEDNIQSCGGLFDGGRMPFHRMLGWRADDPRANKTEKVSWTTGAYFLTRRTLWDELGGFDTVYGPRGYFEDVDFCLKAKEKGFETWYCAEASATHAVGSSMGADKTPAEQHKAAQSFYQNARTFESRWAEKITPDVPIQMVSF
jgi:O-antigen biosynthesis protein